MSYRRWQWVVWFDRESNGSHLVASLALWLDQSKTLRQQEIDEQSTVVLRRKYFFSDTNIDQRDPVQLNLLYVQVSNETSRSGVDLSPSVSKWYRWWNTSCDIGWSGGVFRSSMSDRVRWSSGIKAQSKRDWVRNWTIRAVNSISCFV